MEKKLNEFYAELDSWYAYQNFDAVEHFLLDELREHGNECFTCHNPIAVTVLNELGSLYRYLGRQKEAIEMFEAAAKALETRGRANTEEFASAVNNLSEVYRMDGQFEKAIINAQRALAIFEKCVGKKSYPYSSALNNLGLAYLKKAEGEKAKDIFLEAINILEQSPSHVNYYMGDMAVTLCNLAAVYLMENALDKAKEYTDKALACFSHLSHGEMYHISSVYNMIGDIYRMEQDNRNALKAYKQAMEWINRYYGKNFEYQKLENKVKCLFE